MTHYEKLQSVAERQDIVVREKPLTGHDGLIYENRIAIRDDIPTSRQKACVLAEELGHYYTSVGNILDQKDTGNRKQELRARMWGYGILIQLSGLIRAFEHGCRSRYEIAEYLEVTEEYLEEALTRYRDRYGVCVSSGSYIIYFVPFFSIAKIFE